VAKILVADDNSNIQRMVGLALKDQGIDVVAVGNGEAAVRKISELRPDLVLADVFMPVRNGYEVCQYVKEDASLAHIPVILLVGAFDPLDEQEAQRVGADGVLKKPFVPPDPLIAMVKAALQRAGVSLTQGGAEKTSAPVARRGADLLPPAPTPAPPAPAPVSSPLAGISFSSQVAPIVADESFVDMPEAPQPVKEDATKHTVAFGSLLGPTTTEDAGADDAVAGGDWRSLDEPADVPEEEEEEEENKDSTPAWRRDSADTVFHDEDGGGPVKDWRDSAVVQTAGRKSARETWDQSGEVSGFVTAADVPSEMGAFATEVSALEAETLTASTPAASAEVPDSSAPVEIANPPEAAVAAGDSEAATVSDVGAEPEAQMTQFVHSAVETVETVREYASSSVSEPEPQPVAAAEASQSTVDESVPMPTRVEDDAEQTATVPSTASDASSTSSTTDSWFSRPTSPWDTEPVKTDSLAASWNTAPDSNAAGTQSEPAAKMSNGESTNEEAAAVLSDEPAAVDTSRDPGAAEQIASVVASETVSASAVRTQAEMDELVAKVLSKISPEVLHAAAMEMLKPVITALIENEVKDKK